MRFDLRERGVAEGKGLPPPITRVGPELETASSPESVGSAESLARVMMVGDSASEDESTGRPRKRRPHRRHVTKGLETFARTIKELWKRQCKKDERRRIRHSQKRKARREERRRLRLQQESADESTSTTISISETPTDSEPDLAFDAGVVTSSSGSDRPAAKKPCKHRHSRAMVVTRNGTSTEASGSELSRLRARIQGLCRHARTRWRWRTYGDGGQGSSTNTSPRRGGSARRSSKFEPKSAATGGSK